MELYDRLFCSASAGSRRRSKREWNRSHDNKYREPSPKSKYRSQKHGKSLNYKPRESRSNNRTVPSSFATGKTYAATPKPYVHGESSIRSPSRYHRFSRSHISDHRKRHPTSSQFVGREPDASQSSRNAQEQRRDDERSRCYLHEPINPSDIRVTPRRYGPSAHGDATTRLYRSQVASNTERNRRGAYSRPAASTHMNHPRPESVPTWTRPASARYDDAIMYAPRGAMRRAEPRVNASRRGKRVRFAA